MTLNQKRGYTKAALQSAGRIAGDWEPDLEDAAIIDAAFRPAIDALFLIHGRLKDYPEMAMVADRALRIIGIPNGWL